VCVSKKRKGGSVRDSVIDVDEVAVNLVGEHVQNVVEHSCEGPGPTPLRQFMSVDEVYAILRETECEQVLSDVPRGVKENVWYVVDKSGNVERQADGKKNVFGMIVVHGAVKMDVWLSEHM